MFEGRKRKENDPEGDKACRIRETQKESKHIRGRIGETREGVI